MIGSGRLQINDEKKDIKDSYSFKILQCRLEMQLLKSFFITRQYGIFLDDC